MLGHAPLSQAPLSTLDIAAVDASLTCAATDDANALEVLSIALEVWLFADGVVAAPPEDLPDDKIAVFFELELLTPDIRVDEFFTGALHDSFPDAPVPTLALGGAGVTRPRRVRGAAKLDGLIWPEPDPWQRKFKIAKVRPAKSKGTVRRSTGGGVENQDELELLLALALGIDDDGD